MAEEYNKWIEEHGGNLVFIWLMGLFVATVSCYAADVWFELATLARVILVLTCTQVFGFFGVVTFLVPQILSCIDRKREGRSGCPDHSIFIFFWILGFIILVPTFIFFHCRLTRNLLILWGVLYWIVVEIFWAIFGKEEKIEWDEEDEPEIMQNYKHRYVKINGKWTRNSLLGYCDCCGMYTELICLSNKGRTCKTCSDWDF